MQCSLIPRVAYGWERIMVLLFTMGKSGLTGPFNRSGGPQFLIFSYLLRRNVGQTQSRKVLQAPFGSRAAVAEYGDSVTVVIVKSARSLAESILERLWTRMDRFGLSPVNGCINITDRLGPRCCVPISHIQSATNGQSSSASQSDRTEVFGLQGRLTGSHKDRGSMKVRFGSWIKSTANGTMDRRWLRSLSSMKSGGKPTAHRTG